MPLKIDKNLRFFVYGFILVFLTSINNYNLFNKKLFNISHIEVNGFSDKKNTLIKDEIRNTIDKNIFFVEKKNFKKLIDRNDTKDLLIKKIYPNKLIINFIPAKPICIILFKDDKIILGDNGKKLNIKTTKKKLPIVSGSENIDNIFKVVNLLRLSKLDYDKINKIILFKSGRFDINLESELLIRFPIKYTEEIINHSNRLLNDKKFINSKVIDLRLKNRIIKYE
tara:strand:+ start:714 stop:1388 length:675 start_codon:yes stop_codon:yes gene_type:complete